ncbi:sigma 54-interacting transcriptional regulator [Romboutsia sp. 1001216sp1]|uniref:sigma 54-interacting transcriptional regulator n=1 Tax=unclassified Romboutsia TaxID=2626894 RepID=UPI0018AB16F7|nr:sigma 54-interacting transcriptional regulator [Romboutsia sp. 1001216sp1]MDB8792313.1 sigma 54-interacting transcriptional regulator [Romboutsia sp. 1001216sp1]MDB8795608.1 sigma 54-interacting transcriptional regulator [Romboutsia sp. 1001216sp1]MDB8798513.1 sigma 54-interacting transcriptional regulator [Romboutsia sp. 1001216sp1]
MENVIGVIASNIELKEKIETLYPREIKNKEIIIDIIELDLLEEQGKILVDKGAQVIIGRGGGYKLILDTVNVPIIPLNMKSIDLLKAIKLASTYKKEIVLILGYDEVDFDYISLKDVINIRIKEEWFKSKYEIRSKVLKYIDKKEGIVIVGSGIACSFARQYNIDNVFINASEESITEVIEYAKNIISSLSNEKFNNQMLINILDGVKDGIIAIDTKGKIILFNESAKKILNTKKEEVYKKNIKDVFPCMDWLVEAMIKNESHKRKIRNINKLTVNTRSVPIIVDGQVQGIIGILQDITNIQSLERKIRMDLNNKGLCAKYTFDDYIFKDEISKELVEMAKKIGKTEFTTLLYGESGCGKEVLAQSMHNISQRKDKPFVAINCATISESLLESELFGYEEGAFTGAKKGGKPGLFELAHGGSIFLDEINSLPINIQTKLLRVIEEKKIMRMGSDRVIPLDIRIMAATNENLRQKIKDKTFRADLFYRLSSLEINIPPLRKRKKDIVFLFEYFVRKMIEEGGFSNLSSISDNFQLKQEEVNLLNNHNWLGNIRELKNVAQKYVLTGKIEILYVEDEDNKVDEYNLNTCNSQFKNINYEKIGIDIKEINKYVETKIINILLSQGLNKTQVASILGISRTALWKKYKDND